MVDVEVEVVASGDGEDWPGGYRTVTLSLGEENSSTAAGNLTGAGERPLVRSRDEHLAMVEIAVLAAILALAVLGNGLVVVTLAIRKKKLGRMNLMILHLSIADLFVAFFNVLPQLMWDVTGTFYGGNVLCKLVTFLQLAGMFTSTYVLVTTALDRFFVICRPLASHVWTTARIHVMVGCAWILSMIFSAPQMLIFSYREMGDSGAYNCMASFEPGWTLQLYITWITLAIFVIPAGILCFVYGRISYTVWRSTLTKEPSLLRKSIKQSPCHTAAGMENNNQRYYNSFSRPENGASPSSIDANHPVHGYCQMANGGPRQSTSLARLAKSRSIRSSAATCGPRAHVRTMAKSKVKTIKLTLTVILCYVVCWAPFFITQMWAAWDINAPFEGKAMVIIMLLASLNSCSNPWIYIAFSDVLCNKLDSGCRRAKSCVSTHGPNDVSQNTGVRCSIGARGYTSKHRTVSSESSSAHREKMAGSAGAHREGRVTCPRGMSGSNTWV